ncbi:MAG: quercetin dioxygenase-like cupin family protein [Roseivirga sp.]|jgi:quercetin dioxygenase-like cupin family protein
MKKVLIIASLLIIAVGCTSTEVIMSNTSKVEKSGIENLFKEEKAVQTNVLFNATQGKTIALKIEAGEKLKEHVSPVDAFLICVKGKGFYATEKGDTTAMKPGDYLFIEADLKHEVVAVTESHFLLVK